MEIEPTISTDIEIAPKEEQLFQLLLDIVKVNKLGTTMRVAGGWVRDKLRGLTSDDIDIALDNISGETMAKAIQSYMKERNMEVRGFGVIKANPDRCKHLTAATIRVFDYPLDLVNLRKDDYAGDNNGMIVEGGTADEFGTPESDAKRRDLTINGLFYNLHTKKVEDYVNGLEDFKNKIIRTPIPPQDTMNDDPLRILRVFRFTCKFGFNLAPELKECIADPILQKKLNEKIARDRIGKEFKKGITGNNPKRYLSSLTEFGLLKSVFIIPKSALTSFSKEEFDKIILDKIKPCLEAMNLSPFLQKADVEGKDPYKTLLIVLACLLVEFYPVKKVKEAKRVNLIEYLLKVNLTFPKPIPYQVNSLINGIWILRENQVNPVSVGRMIRETGNLWPIALHIIDFVTETTGKGIKEQAFALIQLLELENYQNFKPIINGNDIIKNFTVNKRCIKEIIDRYWDWQVENIGSTKEDFFEWLKENMEEKWVAT